MKKFQGIGVKKLNKILDSNDKYWETNPLRRWRRLSLYEVQDIAYAMGIGVSMLMKIEAGERIPNVNMLFKISIVSGGAVTPNDMYYWFWRKHRYNVTDDLRKRMEEVL